MLRRLVQFAGAASLLFVFVITVQTARADDPPGAKLFATYCAACHGEAGKGAFAPGIGTDNFLNSHDDASIIQATSEGNVPKGMPAWSKANGGSLTDDQISDIVAYLRSLATGPTTSAATPAPTVAATTESAGAATEATPAATPVPASTPVPVVTKLGLSQVTGKDGGVVLNAMLTGDDGKAIQGASVSFSRVTSLGNVDLGSAKTNAQGIAALQIGEIPSAARQVIASFKGDKNSSPSQSTLALEPPVRQVAATDIDVSKVSLSIDQPLLSPEGSLIAPNPPLVPATLFVLVVLGVWSIYGLVVYQLVRVRKAGKVESRVNKLTYMK